MSETPAAPAAPAASAEIPETPVEIQATSNRDSTPDSSTAELERKRPLQESENTEPSEKPNEPKKLKEDLAAVLAENMAAVEAELARCAHTAGVQEADVGITAYVSPNLPGFKGTLKQRYTDFLVNEIDLNNRVLHLTDTGFLDKKARRRERRKGERNEGYDRNSSSNQVDQPKKEITYEELDPSKRGELVELLGEETVRDIVKLFHTGNNIQTEKSFPSKEVRTRLHQLLRETFDGRVDSFTTTENQFKIALATRNSFPKRWTGKDGNSGEKKEEKQEKSEKPEVSGDTGNSGTSEGAETSANSDDQKGSAAITAESEKSGIVGQSEGQKNSATSAALNTSAPASIESLGPPKPFLHFLLYKENKETMEAASLLAKFLRIAPKSIRYAGTKDRRGVTVQQMCIHKMKADRVNGLNRTLRGIKLGCFSYKDEGLRLGELNGNEFVITIRDVIAETPEIVEAALCALRENGFINYFGMQRFGTFSVSTHVIGRHLLAGEFGKACELLLAPQAVSAPESVEARRLWKENRNAAAALQKMPRRCAAEHSILRVLEKEQTGYSEAERKAGIRRSSYLAAVMQIPRNLRVMYGHAYQSYVWNAVASKRVELFGLKIVPGDLVVEGEKTGEAQEAEEEDMEGLEEDVKGKDGFTRARAVTEEEIAAGKFSIYDVVLPTPGFDVEYPSNPALRAVYVEKMAEDGLDPFTMGRNIREFSLAGTYRKLLARPADMQWWIRKYEDPVEQLVLTDLQILEKKAAADSSEGSSEVSQIVDTANEGSRTAVVLKMKLGTSAYATMALREVMKTDTSRRGDGLDVRVSAAAA